ncbi:hypothetical protein KPL74_20110 [Bacillus sp. NP157]|nr:hypothetical protein KPL74_20110 [Bacillus sp. NP157]
MAEERQVWLKQGENTYGPYDESLVQRWLDEGKIRPDVLGRGDDGEAWVEVVELVGDTVTRFPARGAALPEPAGPGWGLVLMLCLVTLGFIAWVWAFLQVNWVRRIDPGNRSREWLIASAAGSIAVIALRETFLLGSLPYETRITLLRVAMVLNIGTIAAYLASAYSMVHSMRRVLPMYGLRPQVSGITLFFFNTIYLQAQMDWVRRARTDPAAAAPVSTPAIWAVCLPLFTILSFLVMTMGSP